MTERFYKYGIHAEVNDSGELFMNITAVTLGNQAAREFAEFVGTAVLLKANLDELSALTQDQADADGMNDDDYRSGHATPMETNLAILAAQEPGIEQVSEEQFTAEVEALNAAPAEAGEEAPQPPPYAGAGATQAAWAEYAAKATDSPVEAWSALTRKGIVATLKEEGVL